MTKFTGPTNMDCAEECEVPEGVEIVMVPTPRHNWSDVVHCPNDNCGRSFLVLKAGPEVTAMHAYCQTYHWPDEPCPLEDSGFEEELRSQDVPDDIAWNTRRAIRRDQELPLIARDHKLLMALVQEAREQGLPPGRALIGVLRAVGPDRYDDLMLTHQSQIRQSCEQMEAEDERLLHMTSDV